MAEKHASEAETDEMEAHNVAIGGGSSDLDGVVATRNTDAAAAGASAGAHLQTSLRRRLMVLRA